jgi:hypothetical protein
MRDGGAGSCGQLCAALAGRLPVPGQKLVQLMALGSPGDDALQHVGQIGLRIEFVELGRLCRLPNYAEWFWEEPVVCAYLPLVERSEAKAMFSSQSSETTQNPILLSIPKFAIM